MPSPDALIARIYAAIPEPGGWQQMLHDYVAALGGSSGFVFATDDTMSVRGNIAAVGLTNPDHLDRYFSHFAARNPYHHLFRDSPEGEVRTLGALAFGAAYRRSEWFDGWVRPQGYGDSMGCHLVRGRDFRCWLGVRREDGLGEFPAGRVALARATAPHLGNALKVWARLERERRAGETLAGALDGLATAVLVVDGDGRILRANAAAGRLLAAADAVVGRRGHLGCRDRGAAKALLDAVRAAAGPPFRAGPPASIAAARGDGRRPVLLRVVPVPLPGAWGGFARRGAAAAVFVVDPEAARPGRLEAFSAVYGLTPAEARTLALTLRGEGLPRAAAALGIAPTTARTYLQQVFAKTGTARQAELVRLFFETTVP
jgi:DNA-binding CsgD family transcriptional regulator/PAS domain-containing protein